MKKHLHLFVALILLVGAVTQLHAQGTAFTYQGRLTENGAPASGPSDFTFTLYDAANGGAPVGASNVVNDLAVTNGLFTVVLDFGAAFDGSARWLQIAVRPGASAGAYTNLIPRQPITATPYALRALNAGSANTAAAVAVGAVNNLALASDAVDGAKLLNGSITSADLNASLLNGTFWNLGGNAGTTPGAQFLGTSDNQPLEFKVNGVRALRLEPTAGAPNVIGGEANNQITAPSGGAGVLSGAGHRIFNASDYSVIAGGLSNRIQISSPGGFIGGGQANWIVNTSTNSVIAGGAFNQVSRDHSFIGGGLRHTNRSSFAFIGGGWENRVGLDADYSTIAGGRHNTIEDDAHAATIGGGAINTIQSNVLYATIAGGSSNEIGTNSNGSAIGGGVGNAIGDNSPFATIPGGSANYATNNAFAAGRLAKAIHAGAFVWADYSEYANVASQRDNQFRVRADGGVRFDFNAGEWVDLRYQSNILTSARIINTSSGGYLSLGGAWVNASDRERKTHFTPVDPQAVLAKVAAMPLSEWSYRAEGASVRHVGPMAQDFHAAFGLGGDDKSIGTVDADGVALAAIQGLNEKVESGKQKAERRIEKLEAENAALKQRLERLERLMGGKNGGGK